MTRFPSLILALLGTAAAVAPGAALADSTEPGGKPPAGVVAQQAPPLPASDIVIDFEQDAPGAKPNGFASADSPAVTFHDTTGADLDVGDFGTQSRGQALAVFPDDDSGLRIVLARPTFRLALAFGNDDPSASEPGDEAVLTLFRGAAFVGECRVTMNRDDVMNQTISCAPGPLFNRAVFRYETVSGLIEIVDDIRIAPLCTVAGTEGPDVLNGTASRDVICGGGGNDTINAQGGNDTVYGGFGNDAIRGGVGRDELRGGIGADRINGEAGDDLLAGEAGNDTLNGGPGTDRCLGGEGTDTASACEARVGIP